MIDCQVKSMIYREIFSSRGRNDVISVINAIDLEDKSKHKIVCSAYLERELLRFGKQIVDKRIRITNRGQAPGKKYYVLEVVDLDATPQPPITQPVIPTVSDEDIPF